MSLLRDSTNNSIILRIVFFNFAKQLVYHQGRHLHNVHCLDCSLIFYFQATEIIPLLFFPSMN